MAISLDTEKTYNEVQHHFMLNSPNSNKLGIKGRKPNIREFTANKHKAEGITVTNYSKAIVYSK